MAATLQYRGCFEALDHKGWEGECHWLTDWVDRYDDAPQLGDYWEVGGVGTGWRHMGCVRVEFHPIGGTEPTPDAYPHPQQCIIKAYYSSRELVDNVWSFRSRVQTLEGGYMSSFTWSNSFANNPSSGAGTSVYQYKSHRVIPWTEGRLTKLLPSSASTNDNGGIEIIHGDLMTLAGKINNAAWTPPGGGSEYPAGTVLFLGVDSDTYEITNNGAADFETTYKVQRATYLFGIMTLQIGADYITWNHVWRPKRQRVTSGHSPVGDEDGKAQIDSDDLDGKNAVWGLLTPPLYESGSFGNLF